MIGQVTALMLSGLAVWLMKYHARKSSNNTPAIHRLAAGWDSNMAKNKKEDPTLNIEWMGKPLSEYSKRELRGIIFTLVKGNNNETTPYYIPDRAFATLPITRIGTLMKMKFGG
jgi:hypothetical protein